MQDPAAPTDRGRLLLLLGAGAWLVAVLAVAFPLAMRRHFQVDEFNNVYNASLLSRWGGAEAAVAVHPEAFQAILGRLTRGMGRASDVLLTFRAVFAGFFTVNLLLLAWAQPQFRRWHERLLVLVGATLLVPLWEYGFEVRHDVLLLTGALALFALLQWALARGRLTAPVAAGVGAALLWMLVSAQKAPAYVLPLGALTLWIAADRYPGGSRRRRVAGAAGWMAAGFLVAALLVAAAVWASGRLGVVLSGAFSLATQLEGISRLSPLPALVNFARPHPYLGLLAAAHLVLATRDRLAAPRTCGPSTVTLAFLLVAAAVLFVNVSPFPYNLLLFAPFVFLAALDVAARLRPGRSRTLGLAALVVAGALGTAAAVRARPYLWFPNAIQLGFVAAAEDMTAPADPVFDGIGMVVTRPPADRHWMLHSSFMRAYGAGRRTAVSEIVRREAPPVVLMSYRLRWLQPSELALLGGRYIELQPDFLVLGGLLSPGDRQLVVHRAGRYVVDLPPGATIAGRRPAAGIVTLPRGAHALEGVTTGGGFHWVGPAAAVPPIPQRPRAVPLLMPFS